MIRALQMSSNLPRGPLSERRGDQKQTIYELTGTSATDLDQLRILLREMSDADLLRFGQAAKYMCPPEANLGRPSSQPRVVQPREARAEWKRHKPSLPLNNSI